MGVDKRKENKAVLRGTKAMNGQDMPLTARTIAGEKVCILDFENADQLYSLHPRGTLISPFPDIETPVFARFCTHKINHFAHKGECLTRYGVHPYSLDHEAAKLVMGRFIQSYFKMQVNYEIPIGNRIVDVFGTSAEGNYLAIECQFSPITTDELLNRSRDILSEGIELSWAFGSKAQTQTNIEAHESLLGAPYFLSVQNETKDYGPRELASLARDFRMANKMGRSNGKNTGD